METIRWFSSDVEALAPRWRKKVIDDGAWTQVDPEADFQGHGEAGGFLVTCGALDGYAKQSGHICRAANEKVASDLAFDLRLPVPPVVLIEAQGHHCSVSSIPFRPPWKWGHAKTLPELASMTPRLELVSSAMVVFDTWVDNSDRCNEGNVLVTAGLPDGPGVAYIDYAYSLSKEWGENAAPPVTAMRGPYPQLGQLQRETAFEVIGAIEALTDDHIHTVVNRIPDEFLSSTRRSVVADGLVSRRDTLRDFFEAHCGAHP